MGAATARLFATRGAEVVIASRDISALGRLSKEIQDGGGTATPIQVDLADPPSIKTLGEVLTSQFGRLDCTFNNAGEGMRPAPLAEVSDEDFDRVQRVTVKGTFLALKQEIPLMLKRGGGTIVNMSSTAGVSAFSGGSAYTTAKHAIIGLTRSAAIDYAQRGIRVNAVAPGPIDTERLQGLPEEYRERTRQAVPMHRLGLPEEVAETVLWLSGDGSRFVTGVTVFVDGGRMAGSA
ncbi:MAG: SDR family oxidoreductase [Thermoplasmata archaeon]|nr:SDR family oxidoreductase [Thermoplasmata archaeon]